MSSQETTPRASVPLARVLATLGTRWRVLSAVTLSTALVAAGLLLLIRNRYAATVLLAPEAANTQTPSAITSLAALSGLPLAGLAPESPQFYVSLLRSRPVQYAMLREKFPRPFLPDVANDSAALVDLLRIRRHARTD